MYSTEPQHTQQTHTSHLTPFHYIEDHLLLVLLLLYSFCASEALAQALQVPSIYSQHALHMCPEDVAEKA